jgi:hypothetical protein
MLGNEIVMHRLSTKSATGNLRQHFHNYFDLLLGGERSKLQHVIRECDECDELSTVLMHIDCRIDYLRGAVRMGKLLCLIDDEESKTKLGLLSNEREKLRACILPKQKNPAAPTGFSSAEQLASIRKSLRPTTGPAPDS